MVFLCMCLSSKTWRLTRHGQTSWDLAEHFHPLARIFIKNLKTATFFAFCSKDSSRRTSHHPWIPLFRIQAYLNRTKTCSIHNVMTTLSTGKLSKMAHTMLVRRSWANTGHILRFFVPLNLRLYKRAIVKQWSFGIQVTEKNVLAPSMINDTGYWNRNQDEQLA